MSAEVVRFGRALASLAAGLILTVYSCSAGAQSELYEAIRKADVDKV